MEAIHKLSAEVTEIGAKLREVKDNGGDFKPLLDELQKAKVALSDLVVSYLPTQEKVIAEMESMGVPKEKLEEAQAVYNDLKSKIFEDKKAKKKREKEEKKKKQEEEAKKAGAAAAAAGGADGEDGEKKLSKKELNKLKRKAGKKGEALPDGVAPPPSKEQIAKLKAAASGGPASGGPAPAAVVAAPRVNYPLVASVVANLVKTKLASDNTLKLKDGSILRGDLTIARYLARSNPSACLYGESDPDPAAGSASVDEWVEVSQTHRYQFNTPEVLSLLNSHLKLRTYIAGHNLSLADIAIWSELVRVGPALKLDAYADLSRWYTMVSGNRVVAMCKGIFSKLGGSKPAVTKKRDTKYAGIDYKDKDDKYKLPGLKSAVPGEVVTRFPPEPSGHLHIGHVKAIFLNKYYAERYNGKMLVRFDDTNPSKEKVEYEEGIIEDLKSLGVVPYKVSHTSDHFELILQKAVHLIQNGDAYMDDTSGEKMSEQRGASEESVRRDSAVRDNLVRFMCMVFGQEAAHRAAKYGVKFDKKEVEDIDENAMSYKKWCLRAKIEADYDKRAHGNKALWDPVIFRTNEEPHARTGHTYGAYPTYDLACPIVDSIEGVTHAMRDIQYRERTPLYAWFFPKLGLRPVEIQDFSRMNFVYTLMSKRKLKWFVDSGKVANWADPRFPTVKGILRRGMQVEALYDFMVSQGSSKNTVDMEWDKFWALNKKYTEPTAPRFMAVSKDDNVEFHINGPDGKPYPECVKTVPVHPKDKDGSKYGFRSVFLGPIALVEKEDLEAIGEIAQVQEGENVVLMNFGIMKVTKVEKGPDGKVSKLYGQYDPDNKDFNAQPRKLHFVTKSPHNTSITMHEFDYLVTKSKLEEDEDFHQFINENSHAVTELIGDPGLRKIGENQFLQLIRRGFFRVDEGYKGPGSSIQLFMIPDGKLKAMSTLGSKLAHR